MIASVGGSSPLTRGKLCSRVTEGVNTGLIPAHAGKTSTPMNTWRSGRAHPRSRGENISASCSAVSMVGSSPLTRGKLGPLMCRLPPPRLIPAHAGKTTAPHDGRNRGRAHPRSRGENQVRTRLARRLAGSSPLTRGKLQIPKPKPHRKGLIPAHAGKTLPDLRFYRADRSDLGKP